jgi:hypothetical protein
VSIISLILPAIQVTPFGVHAFESNLITEYPVSLSGAGPGGFGDRLERRQAGQA